MINKLAIGAGLAATLAIVVLFKLLMSSNEAKATALAELDEAVRANQSNVELIDRIEAERDQIQADYEAERRRSAEFTAAVVANQQELERQKNDFRRQLADVRVELTVEELACADSTVPDAYFDGLRVGSGGGDEGGVPGSPGADTS